MVEGDFHLSHFASTATTTDSGGGGGRRDCNSTDPQLRMFELVMSFERFGIIRFLLLNELTRVVAMRRCDCILSEASCLGRFAVWIKCCNVTGFGGFGYGLYSGDGCGFGEYGCDLVLILILDGHFELRDGRA